MTVKYKFIPEHKSTEAKIKSDMLSYAGRLLEMGNSPTLIIGLDNFDNPFIWQCSGRLVDAFDFSLETD